MAGSAAEFRRLIPENPRSRAPDTARPPVQAASLHPTLCGAGDALCGLLAPAAFLGAFISRARSCLALAGWRLMRGRAARLRAARLRRRAGLRLRIPGRCTRAALGSSAPGTRIRSARGLRGSAATLAGLLIHHGPVLRALCLWRPIRLRAGGTVSHRRALRLWRPIRLRADSSWLVPEPELGRIHLERDWTREDEATASRGQHRKVRA